MSKAKLKFKLVSADNAVARMIRQRGHEVAGSGEKFDCLIFTGGADIHPFTYGQKKHKNTHCTFHRDLHEIRMFRTVPKHFPKLGICRGGQLLNCLSGGSMWQDVSGHHGSHSMWDMINDRIIRTTSVHHQMMKPASDAIPIAWAKEATFKEDDTTRIDYSKERENDWDDPEMLYYQDTNCLCVQGHPEYTACPEFTDFVWDCIDAFFFPETDPDKAEKARSAIQLEG